MNKCEISIPDSRGFEEDHVIAAARSLCDKTLAHNVEVKRFQGTSPPIFW